jgi:hypothetical protein
MRCQKRDLAFGVAGVTVVVITPRQVKNLRSRCGLLPPDYLTSW